MKSFIKRISLQMDSSSLRRKQASTDCTLSSVSKGGLVALVQRQSNNFLLLRVYSEVIGFKGDKDDNRLIKRSLLRLLV